MNTNTINRQSFHNIIFILLTWGGGGWQGGHPTLDTPLDASHLITLSDKSDKIFLFNTESSKEEVVVIAATIHFCKTKQNKVIKKDIIAKRDQHE